MKISQSKWILPILAKPLLYGSLLFLLTLFTFSAVSAQQRLLSIKKYDYNLPNIGDSSVFIYGNNPGTLYSNEPVFEFDGSFFNRFYIKPLIKCNTEYRFGSSSSTPFDTINYQLTAGLVTSTESTLNPTKNLYAYNTNNNLVSSEKQVLYSFSPIGKQNLKKNMNIIQMVSKVLHENILVTKSY